MGRFLNAAQTNKLITLLNFERSPAGILGEKWIYFARQLAICVRRRVPAEASERQPTKVAVV